MKDVFLLYDTSCLFEIVILNYFMSLTGCEIIYCSLDGQPVRATEGYSVNVDMALKDVDPQQIRSFIVPGGDITSIDTDEVRTYLQELKSRKVLIGGICAGVDLLAHAGILDSLESTQSSDLDIVNDGHVITARANAYVDFAIETAKELELFEDEADLEETIEFWKYHKRAQ
ncbi:hypothetical protein D3Z53_24240 [Lachnospiraceae bacterium]|jgi:putative intracellular protease/amidase|nr:DJ-1/PfpI family protein [uncultured Schaedlerella sp.]MCI9152883.1 hypothetical protein [Ruminococcus sp.]NBI61036.1 hypothetical protein [Lachnospiraceae bacterium]